MKIIILFALVTAAFQGCNSEIIVLKTSLHNFLNSFDTVASKLDTVVDSMEVYAQQVIDTMLGGATAGACVIALQEELKAVSGIVSGEAYTCIHTAVLTATTTIDNLIKEIENNVSNLLDIFEDLVVNVLVCFRILRAALSNLNTIPDSLLTSIEFIMHALRHLEESQGTCSNTAIIAASKKIANILKRVEAC